PPTRPTRFVVGLPVRAGEAGQDAAEPTGTVGSIAGGAAAAVPAGDAGRRYRPHHRCRPG
ncbi:hypothetical protein, partial [Mycobacterium kansasii]